MKKQSIEKIEERLLRILSGEYCGVALGRDEITNEFIIYSWGDAPVSSDVLGRGKTIQEAALQAERKLGHRK